MQKVIFLVIIIMTATIIYSQTPCPDTTTVTYSGKTYNTVKIGSQCWLKENLDVGTMIEGSQNQTDKGTIKKHCYNNISNNCSKYGGLYQWNEAMQYVTTEKSQGICPNGWHIPTKKEFQMLNTTINNNCNILKEIGQGKGTNITGFAALLSGYLNVENIFIDLGYSTTLWSSTEGYVGIACGMGLFYYGSDDGLVYTSKEYSYSVRCLKDN